MKTVFCTTVFLLLLCSYSVFAVSQPPAPSRGEEVEQPDARSQEYKEAASPFKVRTELFTAINKLLDSQNQENGTDSATTTHNKESSTQWWKVSEVWIAIFTGILAFITFFLALFTYKLWSANKAMIEDAEKVSVKQSIDTQESLRLTTISADAAQESIKALCLIERAYVFASVKLGDVKLRENGEFIFHDPAFNTTTLSIMVKLTNQGKTPAILDSIYGGWVSQTDYPTKATVVGLIENRIPKGIVIASGTDSYIVNVLPPPVISDKDWKLIFVNEIKFFCYGRIEYKDVLGKDRKTGFCWEFIPDSKGPRFTISDSDLNEYK